MKYFLLKLEFSSPVHIGESMPANSLTSSKMTLCADTIFSALCHTILLMEGEKGIHELYEYAISDKLRISDAFPYSYSRYFLPKPMILSMKMQSSDEAGKRKIYKKLSYIPLEMIPSYLTYIQGKGEFDMEKAMCLFGSSYLQDKVAIRGFEEPQPYSVGLYSFDQNNGLYIVIGYKEEKVATKITRLFDLLGASGIGGKVSSGYGKFQIADIIFLEEVQDRQLAHLREMLYMESNKYLLITSSLPKDNEMELVMKDCSYTLVRRGGYSYSISNKSPIKKHTQYYFSAGSVFSSKYHGDVYDVSRDIGHPVYRYSIPIFLGVNI